MQTFDQSLASLVEQGAIDLRSAMAAASSPHDLKLTLQNRGIISATERPTATPV